MQLFIFDVDGTLVDSQHHIVEAQTRAFAVHGMPPPSRQAALSVVGLSLREAFSVLVGPEGPVDTLAEAYRNAWTDLRSRPGYAEILFPGASEILSILTAWPNVLLGLATGKSRRGVDRLIEAQGWEGLFATIQTADAHPSKPDPSMLLAALDETGISARAATMIGDSSYDMAMASAAKVRPIGVGWGYHERAALRGSGAKTIAESFDQLHTILASSKNEAA